jgi:hypothetical protein
MEVGMLVACLLLTVIGCLGAFDVFYFHRRQARITERPEARVEAWLHVARGIVYTIQLIAIPGVRFGGAWYAAFVGLFVADVAVAIADVAVEPRTRRAVGGLPPGEYLAHIVLSVLVGAYLHAVFTVSAGWPHEATALTWSPSVPWPLRLVLAVLALGCLVNALLEAAELIDRALPAPRPLHIAVRLRCDLADLWRITQDPDLHPRWDHRFSRIVMLDDQIRTGTRMRYEKTVLGMTIRGFGRYKLHRPLRQSSFEFWSDDPRSLIARGAGLWRYLPRPDGTVDFRTSYTYRVRWGVVGRLLDRVFLRRFMQRETERSFERLRREWFP